MLPKKLIKRWMPEHHKIREHRHLRFFGTLLHDPNLWHLNRRSVAGAIGVGLFLAWMPMPFQMVAAAAIAILVRVNLPLSVVTVWISNPVTMGPMYYLAYKWGSWMLGWQPRHFNFDWSLDWFVHEASQIWQPLLLGCVVAGTLSALLGFTVMRLLWRWHLVQHLRRRREQRLIKKARKTSNI